MAVVGCRARARGHGGKIRPRYVTAALSCGLQGPITLSNVTMWALVGVAEVLSLLVIGRESQQWHAHLSTPGLIETGQMVRPPSALDACEVRVTPASRRMMLCSRPIGCSPG